MVPRRAALAVGMAMSGITRQRGSCRPGKGHRRSLAGMRGLCDLLIVLLQAVDMTRAAILVCMFLGFAPTGVALACPDGDAMAAEQYRFTGRNLWSPERFRVEAGGHIALTDCGAMGWGYVRQAPDMVFDLTRMRRYRRLHLRSYAECDTVLLLRDPSGQWFFDDDSGVGRTASLSLSDPLDGSYAVWVGSFRPEGCEAQLTLESF